ncbi:vacuolar import and degradation protein-domain-containing protein [Fusarium solani]|uniref:Vacuolar import and degradation protein-domain-containing protein n=1 Tax=Fusarium solani TaxID=169388 RepID=A0A9P9JSI6_FUSSL|nr:vacuolar import and degradation protein-domain-containing protein [Fusarium solani]KAH7235288.1 vacuolar import and degradation protein-domain-containing protein [Fusarium solani]
MPTPSSNPPAEASSPRSYSFSTCPDDVQHQQRPSWQSREAVQDHNDDMGVQPTPDASPLTVDAPPAPEGPASDDTIMYEGRSSDDPSTRSSTMSPRPQSANTAVTSPISSGPSSDVTKGRDAEIGSQLSQESSNTRQTSETETISRAPSSRRGSPNHELEWIDADAQEDELWAPSMGADFSCMRTIPSSPSSYLRSGSRFHGTQQSERQVYDVQVEIKHVDMRESFLCGYLRIQGLTEDHPTLTTYFEGEIIGSKYSFYTQHENWGANSKVDLSHWAKFAAFRPFQKQARKGPVTIRDAAQRETIFMRWKEHFLVPDHRVRTITGASFEGFYYICFNQVKGEVSGIYFHSKSEKFQQLELKHVPDRGCFAATEFR